jgi:hypothetical protein
MTDATARVHRGARKRAGHHGSDFEPEKLLIDVLG